MRVLVTGASGMVGKDIHGYMKEPLRSWRTKSSGDPTTSGDERPVTIRELAETIRELTGSKSQLNLAPPRTDLEHRHELTLEQGLQRIIEWL